MFSRRDAEGFLNTVLCVPASLREDKKLFVITYNRLLQDLFDNIYRRLYVRLHCDLSEFTGISAANDPLKEGTDNGKHSSD